MHNGGLAVQLTERAFRSLAQRCVTEHIPGNDPRAKVLTAADFVEAPKARSSGGGGGGGGTGTNAATIPEPGGGAAGGGPPSPAGFEALLAGFKLRAEAVAALAAEGIEDEDTLAMLSSPDLVRTAPRANGARLPALLPCAAGEPGPQTNATCPLPLAPPHARTRPGMHAPALRPRLHAPPQAELGFSVGERARVGRWIVETYGPE